MNQPKAKTETQLRAEQEEARRAAFTPVLTPAMDEMTSKELAAAIDPPSPGADTIKSLRSVVDEIKNTEDTGDMAEMADEAAIYAGRLLADLDELVADLGRGEWGADQLGTLANWLGERGYDIGDEEG